MIRSGVRIGDGQNCLHQRLDNFCLTFTPASPEQRTVYNSILDKIVAAGPTAPELKISILNFSILVRSRKMQYSSTAVQLVEISANENQNFFVRAVGAVPRTPTDSFQSIPVAQMWSVSSSPVVVAQPGKARSRDGNVS